MHNKKFSDEEIALKIVNIYFEEIARFGEKKRLDFDAIINTYFYVLEKLSHKEEMLSKVKADVIAEEKKILHQSKEEIIPSIKILKEKIPENES